MSVAIITAHRPPPKDPNIHSVDELLEREQRVERRAGWREGFDAGRKVGAAAYFNSPVTEGIAFEITVLRIVVDGLERAVRERDDRIEWLEGVIEFCLPSKE